MIGTDNKECLIATTDIKWKPQIRTSHKEWEWMAITG